MYFWYKSCEFIKFANNESLRFCRNGSLHSLADYWYEIYSRLAELDEAFAMKHSFVVFDIFVESDAWAKFEIIPSISAYEKKTFEIDLQRVSDRIFHTSSLFGAKDEKS